MKPNQPVRPQSLAEVAESFAQWRAHRTRRGPTPQALRHQAVALLDHHVAFQVCQALQINGAMLKQWHARHGTEPRSAAVAEISPAQPAPGFVELPATLPAPSAPDQDASSTHSILSVQWPNGTRLSVVTELSTHELLTMLQSLPAPSPSMGEGA